MNLPIFRDLYKLNVALLKDVENIPKIHRHTLGDRIIDTGLSALHQLQRAYDSAQPFKRLHEMSKFSTELGYTCKWIEQRKCLQFEFKGSTVRFFPYTGWFSGKTVKDGRGLNNLLKQIKI